MEHKDFRPPVLALCLLGGGGALAHHSYSMFDPTRQLTVSGTVAKFEWRNPHTYIWIYSPSKDNPGKYDLLAFENGSPAVLSRQGWSRESLKANDKVTVEFAPLRDGKPGGHCTKVTLPDGHALMCPGVGGDPTVDANP